MEDVQKFIRVKKHQPGLSDIDIIITDDAEIKKLYKDLNVGLNVHIKERFVKLEGDNLILKRSSFEKNRRIGKKYFQKKLEVDYLKFNLKTGNFITVRSFGGVKRKRTVTIRQNVFGQLEQILQSKHGSFWSMFGEPDIDGEMYDAIVKCLNSVVDKPFYTLDYWLHQIFIEKKCIKTPNVNAEGFLTKFYPTEKYLKKNNRKLVQSVLDLLDMKDNFTIKLLHKYPFINIRLLKTLHSLLGGSKYLSNIDDHVFEGMESKGSWEDSNVNKFTVNNFIKELDDLPELLEIEKSNLVKVLNKSRHKRQYKNEPFLYPNHTTLYDHFNMLKQIRVYNPNLHMSTTTPRTMHGEHVEFANMISKINKGYVVSYKFNELMVKDMESPLNTYYPHILKNEEEYNEEGSFMKHCVSSYYDKERSIIISLRKGDERWTCEFDVADGMLIQAKGRFNVDPSKEVFDVITLGLLSKTRKWAWDKKLKCIEKVETPLLINGKEVERPQYSIPESTGDLPF
tara:strand:- start:244 stop:1773 length:1530 start_codon:yes stop_codon:yes gene_type:complete